MAEAERGDPLYPASGEPQRAPQEVGGGVQGALARGADVCLGGELPAVGGSL